jgi:hypothetical protein
MLCASTFLAKPFRFFRSQVQNASGLGAEWHLHGSGELPSTLDLGFDFLAEGRHSAFQVEVVEA